MSACFGVGLLQQIEGDFRTGAIWPKLVTSVAQQRFPHTVSGTDEEGQIARGLMVATAWGLVFQMAGSSSV